jgi:hypothetical protein
VGFDVAYQLLIKYLYSSDTGERMWDVNQLFIDLKKTYYSVRREVFRNIPIEFDVSMKLVRLIKMCLNETYNKVHISKHLSDKFPVQNGLKQEMLYRHYFVTLL